MKTRNQFANAFRLIAFAMLLIGSRLTAQTHTFTNQSQCDVEVVIEFSQGSCSGGCTAGIATVVNSGGLLYINVSGCSITDVQIHIVSIDNVPVNDFLSLYSSCFSVALTPISNPYPGGTNCSGNYNCGITNTLNSYFY